MALVKRRFSHRHYATVNWAGGHRDTYVILLLEVRVLLKYNLSTFNSPFGYVLLP